MELVPVIDIKDGVVVRARGGQRADYRPIVTPLARGSAPADIVAAYLRLFPFRTIYVADLDAIDGTGRNLEIVADLTERFPALRFWLDAGPDLANWSQAPNVAPVIGSEWLGSIERLQRLAQSPGAILSLDYRGDKLLGPAALLDAAALWPERVIAMTLARVGSGAGPDLDRLCALARLAPGRRIFAAGGVRGAADLEALAAASAAGALIASSLHDGALGPTELRIFDRP